MIFNICIFKLCMHCFYMGRKSANDSHIQFVRCEFLNQIVQHIVIQKGKLAAVAWIFPDKAGESSGGTAGAQRTDAELTLEIPVWKMGKFLNLFVFAPDNAKTFNQSLSGFRWNYAIGKPVKNPDTKILFQLPDGIA